MGDAGHAGARAPREHQPGHALPGPASHGAWWHVDRAVQLAMASVLGLDEQLPRSRLPRVPPRSRWQPALALQGRVDALFQERGVKPKLGKSALPQPKETRVKEARRCQK